MSAPKKLPDVVTPPQLEMLAGAGLLDLPIYQSYKRSKYLSVKHSSYFQTYEHLLSAYRGKKFTFVEIGVSNGGSLLMWRDYFGPDARIIGIDFNPDAKRFEKDGYEIHIGSQSDPEFWRNFFAQVGEVDIILDDGGHTNQQQILTAHHCIPYIRNGGMLLVEDVHASYLPMFGNPSRYSFMAYAKAMVDRINGRFPEVSLHNRTHADTVYSMSFFESIVAFHIDRRKCFTSIQTSNAGETFHMKDYRRHGTPKIIRAIKRRLSLLGFDPFRLKPYID